MENRYVDVYNFQILKAIEEGHTIYMLDKLEGDTACINEMKVKHVAEVIRESEKDEKRFYFWRVEVVNSESV